MNLHLLLVIGFIAFELGAAVNAKVGSLNLCAAGLVLFGLSLVV